MASDAQPVKTLIDEEGPGSKEAGASSAVDPRRSSTEVNMAGLTKADSNPASPTSPPLSPPIPTSPKDIRAASYSGDYYATRPKKDRLGNVIPPRKAGAMSAVFGGGKVRLPGDLGPNDPRRPKSPAPASLPGDLGPNDPRRPRSRTASPSVESQQARSDSVDTEAPEEGARIMKDPKEPPTKKTSRDSDGDADNDNDNDNDTENGEGKRGRMRKRPEPGRTTAGKAINVREDSEESERDARNWSGGAKPDPTKGESKLSFQDNVTIKVTPPSEKKRVHPSTAYDVGGVSTPVDSEDESHAELREAQRLSLSMSNIHSTPSAHRVIRQIIRGDYAHFQREAEEGRRRQRMYLVATDISPEAEYALEWTIGTVLRDGDTLFAVYAVDEETAGSSGEGGVDIGQGAEMVKDTAAIVKGLPTTNVAPPQLNNPSPLGRSSQLASSSSAETRSASRGVYSNAEAERRRALEGVSARCISLLRKTRLQVRVVVEVFHCKSPRHMITEVIDFLSPTLVIIGSRGRSAVKGVLLGSFSNYLVTKSSVPVMVARKKLRKHSKTVKKNRDGTPVPYSGTGRSGRFSNIIEVPKGKGLRVKGWEQVGID